MAKIIGLGRYFPEHIRKNEDWSPELIESFKDHLKRELLDITDHGLAEKLDQFSLDNIQKDKSDVFLGAVERRVIDNNQPSYEIEMEAAQMAIGQAGVDVKDIGAVFSYSFMPDRIRLSSAGIIAEKLGIKNAFVSPIDTACSSQLTQMLISASLIDSKKVSYILLLASNAMSRGLMMGHPASPGIGDAAVAILLGPDTDEGHQIINTFARNHGDYWDAVVWRRPKGDSLNWWQAGGDFYLGSFDSNKARELIQITATTGAETVRSALAEAGMSASDLDFLVAVQPRKWVNTAITRLLGMPDAASIETYEKYGHIGCCGPVVNLMEAHNQNLIHPGDIVALYAQGAGFTRSATIVKW